MFVTKQKTTLLREEIFMNRSLQKLRILKNLIF